MKTSALLACILVAFCGSFTGGCGSSKLMLEQAGGDLDPGMVRIHVHRKGQMLGGAVLDYWIDWGEGAERNVLIRQFPTPPERRERGIYWHRAPDRGEDPWLTQAVLEQMFRPHPRLGTPTNPAHVDLARLMKPDGQEVLHLSAFGFEGHVDPVRGRQVTYTPVAPKSIIESTMADWPPDACLVGRVGAGGTLTWDRPPGVLDADILTLYAGGALHPTGVRIDLEPGKAYYIEYEMGMISGRTFTVSEEPAER